MRKPSYELGFVVLAAQVTASGVGRRAGVVRVGCSRLQAESVVGLVALSVNELGTDRVPSEQAKPEGHRQTWRFSATPLRPSGLRGHLTLTLQKTVVETSL